MKIIIYDWGIMSLQKLKASAPCK